ncbi:MAG: DUF11 domain-containing protein, partial [Chloroflexota bacterium]
MQKTRENERRDSGIIIILILLLGFICIILASGWALRFAPSWKLNTSMGSNLDPNSDFLTSRPVSLIGPIDPAILTNPAWINIFLTPGASLPTRTPLPTRTITSIPPKTSTPLPIPPTQTTVPTNTFAVIVVVPTNTKKNPPPPPPSTATPIPPPPPSTATTVLPPPPSADLSITKTDNATYYAPNISVQYIIVASNAGPSNVTSATVADTFSGNLTNVIWTCAGSGSASCTAAGAVNINDSAVNLPAGSSVTYTVNATVIGSPVGTLDNTASVNVPAGVTDPTSSNNSATDSDILITANPLPPTIGNIPAGAYSDYAFAAPFIVGPGSYLVYYPAYVAASPTVDMDLVILQLSDGKNWYTILNWGDASSTNNGDI